MKLKIKSQKNTVTGDIQLPSQFTEDVREDIIKRAVEAYWKNNRQSYGADPRAGQKASADLSRRRHNYRGSYGFGISRVPRKILSRRGTRMFWVGAVAPGMVGGRRAHAPKSSKVHGVKINDKERRKAIRSSMAATIIPEVVMARGHLIPQDYPFVISADIENVKSTKMLKESLLSLGFKEELDRANVKKIRPGKGKLRGRQYKKKTSLLIIAGADCPLLNCNNIPGVDVVSVERLNASMLSPGTVPGRVALWTENAIKTLKEKKLYM